MHDHTLLSKGCNENIKARQYAVNITFGVQGLHDNFSVTIKYKNQPTPLSNIISLNSFILSSSESIFFFSCTGTFLAAWTTATGSSAGAACSSWGFDCSTSSLVSTSVICTSSTSSLWLAVLNNNAEHSQPLLYSSDSLVILLPPPHPL